MVWEFMVSGGWPMVPILFCSVLALALLLERGFFWSVLYLNRDDSLRQELLSLRADPERAQRSADPLCQVMFALIRVPRDPTTAVSLADRVVSETRSTIPILNVIAAASTSLGLLGTVLGVALAFQRSAGSPHMSELAGALSVALNTTIFGLLVYLPTFIGSSVSQMASSRLSLQLEQGINADMS
ncbi:MotA/TolQ/ExbB proton channel family protein, partial [Planctomycetota bacterium]